MFVYFPRSQFSSTVHCFKPQCRLSVIYPGKMLRNVIKINDKCLEKQLNYSKLTQIRGVFLDLSLFITTGGQLSEYILEK